jgi:hypothetical protein
MNQDTVGLGRPENYTNDHKRPHVHVLLKISKIAARAGGTGSVGSLPNLFVFMHNVESHQLKYEIRQQLTKKYFTLPGP